MVRYGRFFEHKVERRVQFARPGQTTQRSMPPIRSTSAVSAAMHRGGLRDIRHGIQHIRGGCRRQFAEQRLAPSDHPDPPPGGCKPPGKAPPDPGRGPDYKSLFHGSKGRGECFGKALTEIKKNRRVNGYPAGLQRIRRRMRLRVSGRTRR